jgi:hypothetical protein
MLEDGQPDLVLAFHSSIEESKGTKDMVKRARAAGRSYGDYRMNEKSPYQKGFSAAEDYDPRGRRANEYTYHSPEWWDWERGYADYLSARAEMYEIDDGYGEGDFEE